MSFDSHQATKPQKVAPERLEELARLAVDCGYHIHRDLGPGLLESVYEAILCESLKERGLAIARQVPAPVRYRNLTIEAGFRVDILVENSLVIELKSTEVHAPVHAKQLITYLRLLDLQLGLLMNFGSATYKDGIRRVANNYYAPKI